MKFVKLTIGDIINKIENVNDNKGYKNKTEWFIEWLKSILVNNTLVELSEMRNYMLEVELENRIDLELFIEAFNSAIKYGGVDNIWKFSRILL